MNRLVFSTNGAECQMAQGLNLFCLGEKIMQPILLGMARRSQSGQ